VGIVSRTGRAWLDRSEDFDQGLWGDTDQVGIDALTPE
jgi:hypothetical protein